MAAEISIRGEVRSYNGAPLSRIEVSVYRNAELITHGYTNDEGNYAISLSAGEPITVRFDTHWSLTNSREWHSSVVANLEAGSDILLNRSLVHVGGTEGETADIDALVAYQFAVMWIYAREVDSASEQYATDAAFRLSQLKFTADVLITIQETLLTQLQHIHDPSYTRFHVR
jgi:hypothetical protein